MRLLRRAVLALVLLALLAAGVLWHLNYNDGVDIDAAEPMAADAAVLARGAYLARAGNCLACHTARGGVPAAGGKPIALIAEELGIMSEAELLHLLLPENLTRAGALAPPATVAATVAAAVAAAAVAAA